MTTRRSTWLALGAISLVLAGCASLHDETYNWCQGQDCALRPVVAAAPAPPPAPAPAPSVQQRVTLSADALFEFDRSGTRDILPKGRAELDELAGALRRQGVQVQSLVLTGHADRLGSAPYRRIGTPPRYHGTRLSADRRRRRADASAFRRRGRTGDH